jgi:hypothetical protein
MTAALRLRVRERAFHCCEYCQMLEELSHDPFSVEHILPIVKGGLDDFLNRAWSCLGCNLYKFTATHAFDFVSGDLVPLYNPRQNTWSDHFKWEDDYSLIVGISPIGRATVLRLRLNRLGLVNLRKILVVAGKHPPNL